MPRILRRREERYRPLGFEHLESLCMLTGSIVISGVENVLEPTQMGMNTYAQVTISLTQSMYGASGSVQWATELVLDGATPGDDYVASSGTVNLSYTNTSVQVSVPIKYDVVSEAPEAFRVVLSNPTGSLGIMVGSDSIDILDNNPPPLGGPSTPPPAPTVSFSGSATVFLQEGNSWQLNLVRDMPGGTPDGPLTVYYAIAQASIATSADVTLLPSGSVTFMTGQTSAALTVTAIDDSAIIHMPNEPIYQ